MKFKKLSPEEKRLVIKDYDTRGTEPYMKWKHAHKYENLNNFDDFKLFESPDRIIAYDLEGKPRIVAFHFESDARTFAYADDNLTELMVGKLGEHHYNIEYKYQKETGKKPAMKLEGRIWLDKKYISFYDYPKSKLEFEKTVHDIEKQLKINEDIQIDIWNDPDFKIEIPMSIDEITARKSNIDYNKNKFINLIPLKSYEGDNDINKDRIVRVAHTTPNSKVRNIINKMKWKRLSDEEKKNIVSTLNAKHGDLVLIISGPKHKALEQMGSLRLEMARRLKLLENNKEYNLLWVTKFPLLEWDDETQRYYAMHHPFTSPEVKDIELLEKDPAKVHARAYDLVMNGNEIAGGSIRIHNSELQSKMFNALGISEKEAEEKFGFLMSAFKYGAPPHGGIAFGLDRMIMLFAEEASIRDVIAFPKTTSGLSLMDQSPSSVSEEQLRELHIKLRK
jgi:hypothetical protein